MISSVNSLATHAVTVLTGQRRAAAPVEPVAPIKVVKRRSGHTDDVFKAGEAIGSMIMIASKIDPSSSSLTATNADGIDVQGADATTAQAEAGNAAPNQRLQERGMDAIRLHAAGTGPLAEWAKAYLEAQEKRNDSEASPTRNDTPRYIAFL
ncbi:hypothetical protein [Rhizobium sp.]